MGMWELVSLSVRDLKNATNDHKQEYIKRVSTYKCLAVKAGGTSRAFLAPVHTTIIMCLLWFDRSGACNAFDRQ